MFALFACGCMQLTTIVPNKMNCTKAIKYVSSSYPVLLEMLKTLENKTLRGVEKYSWDTKAKISDSYQQGNNILSLWAVKPCMKHVKWWPVSICCISCLTSLSWICSSHLWVIWQRQGDENNHRCDRFYSGATPTDQKAFQRGRKVCRTLSLPAWVRCLFWKIFLLAEKTLHVDKD